MPVKLLIPPQQHYYSAATETSKTTIASCLSRRVHASPIYMYPKQHNHIKRHATLRYLYSLLHIEYKHCYSTIIPTILSVLRSRDEWANSDDAMKQDHDGRLLKLSWREGVELRLSQRDCDERSRYQLTIANEIWAQMINRSRQGARVETITDGDYLSYY